MQNNIGPTVTAWFILFVVVLVIVYDIFAYVYWGGPSTISNVMRGASVKWPLLPYLVAFAMGCLYGHFFL